MVHLFLMIMKKATQNVFGGRSTNYKIVTQPATPLLLSKTHPTFNSS